MFSESSLKSCHILASLWDLAPPASPTSSQITLPPPTPHYSPATLGSFCSSSSLNCPMFISVISPSSHVTFPLSFLRSLLKIRQRERLIILYKIVPPSFTLDNITSFPHIYNHYVLVCLLMLCLLPRQGLHEGSTLVWLDAAIANPPVPVHYLTHDGCTLNIC